MAKNVQAVRLSVIYMMKEYIRTTDFDLQSFHNNREYTTIRNRRVVEEKEKQATVVDLDSQSLYSQP